MKYIKKYELNIDYNQDFQEGDIVVCIDDRAFEEGLEIGKEYIITYKVGARNVRVKELNAPDKFNDQEIYSIRRFLYPEDYKEYLIEKEAEKYNL
jgi:hypothetical protein